AAVLPDLRELSGDDRRRDGRRRDRDARHAQHHRGGARPMTSPDRTAAPPGLKLSPDVEKRLDDLARRYPTREATILHVLWAIQEQEGWISEEWMKVAASRCGVPLSHVLGVVSFYTMFHQAPVGRHHVQVCRNITCTMLGAEDLLACARKKLGIENG